MLETFLIWLLGPNLGSPTFIITFLGAGIGVLILTLIIRGATKNL